ncbi:MAG: ABC transporter permease [Candidatus Hydrogenedentes bacterium]|nr:ABC transporter permease [Candidatus Hydrogenedentota bacterium]
MPHPATNPSGRPAAATFVRVYGFLLVALALECAVFEIIARSQGIRPFLSVDNLILILNQSAIYGVVSVGMTFVIIAGGIDLSVGSLIAFGGVVGALVTRAMADALVTRAVADAEWWALAGGWAVALAAGLAAGCFSGLFITRFQIPPFIATLAIMSSVRGAGYLMVGGSPVSDLPADYIFLGRHNIAGHVPVSVIVMLAAFIGGGILLNSTPFGRHVRAIGGGEESARLSGVPVNRVKWIVYCMCSVLAIVGGLILSSKMRSGDPTVGVGDELQVIAAVVVGGTSLSGGRGTIMGTFIGLLIIAVLATGLTWIGMESFGQQVILGIVILAAVLMDRFKGAA